MRKSGLRLLPGLLASVFLVLLAAGCGAVSSSSGTGTGAI